MNGDGDRDLVLEYRTGERKNDFDNVILPNIKGHRYTFGSKYPGKREGEEFVFCRDEMSAINPTYCAIIVDELGKYYIQNDTIHASGRATRSSVYTTFLNSERLHGVEKRLLKVGDVISLGTPESGTPWLGHGKRLTYRVKEVGNDEWLNWLKTAEKSPFDNNLILWKIMTYLPVGDLKTARLVSKIWKEEASKVLEKKAVVIFTFNVHYLDPRRSTRVLRYLYEMRGLKIRKLLINLYLAEENMILEYDSSNSFQQISLLFSPGEPGNKILEDLRKLLKSSHNFSSLILRAHIRMESHFAPFFLILQELGEKLVELELRGDVRSFPKVLPPLPTMSNLKKFIHDIFLEDREKQKWVTHLLPLFAKNLEHFTCNKCDIPEFYLEEFLKHDMPKLKGISIEEALAPECLSLLLELKNPLTTLKFHKWEDRSNPGEQNCPTMLDRLLLKNSKSLRHLDISIIHLDYEIIYIRFPSFPVLEELELVVNSYEEHVATAMRINWGGTLDYAEHFPSLRKLKVSPAWWKDDDDVDSDSDDDSDDEAIHFNSLFPEEGEVRCETVTELWVNNNPLPWNATPAQREAFQRRMGKIKEMFPNVEEIKFMEIED